MEPASPLTQKVEDVLGYIQNNHVTFKDLLSHVLVGQTPRCASYRRWFFADLESILTQIDKCKKGREILRRWTLDLVCEIVDREMRKVTKAFTIKTTAITPGFVEAWSFSSLQSVVGANDYFTAVKPTSS